MEPGLKFLEDNIKGNTRAIIINSPHNPTGYLMSSWELEQIVALARRREILIFSDEVYRFLEYDANHRSSPLCDLYEHAVSLGVMSKSYGLAGLRIGWLVIPNSQAYSRVSAFKDYTSICSSSPSEYLAVNALQQGPKLIARSRELIAQNLQLLDDFFQRHNQFLSWIRPRAGCIAFPRIETEEGIDAYSEALVSSTGVLLLLGSCFDYGTNHFRIGFGRKNFPICLERWDNYLTQHNR